MAPVVFGLDLKEMQWSKFGSKYMFKNRDYHLRRTKFIVYQCALIFCVISESLGTAALSDYTDGERKIQGVSRYRVFNNDYVGAASFNIFAGIFVAFIFGAAFFFDLFWPERKESKSVMLAWKICGVLAVIFHLAAALTLTVITATHRSTIRTQSGAVIDNEQFWWNHYRKHSEAPLIYRHNGRAVAAVVFVWLGWVSVLPSCVLLFLGIDNTEKGPGPKSAHARSRDVELGSHTETGSVDTEKQSEQSATDNSPAAQRTDGYDSAAPATPGAVQSTSA